MRKWSQQDLNQIKNILVALNRADFKVQGQELLAFGQAVRWISVLHDEVVNSLKPSIDKAVIAKTQEPQKQKNKKGKK